ncbi:MAG: sel1 repeat family protein [Verrucomicrobia bacterium]|nr:sel1 repeat family protein [Verrucomicrobiota bacterium]
MSISPPSFSEGSLGGSGVAAQADGMGMDLDGNQWLLLRGRRETVFWVLTLVGLLIALPQTTSMHGQGSPNRSGRDVKARGSSDATVSPEELFQRAQYAESTKDHAQALSLYRRAAGRGHPPSQNNLGLLYFKGLGGKRDPEEAVKWFREAARQSYPQAQNNLGVCFRDGVGVQQSFEEAAKWFMQAAEQGYAEAQNNLGVRFYQGTGMPKNPAMAVSYYKRSADQGLAAAWVNLGVCHVDGRGMPKDLNKAFECFTIAAQKGDSDGLLNLGFAHMQGHGVPKDLVRAYVCFNTAVSHGDGYASQARTRLRREMSEKQVQEAQRRSYQYSTRETAER